MPQEPKSEAELHDEVERLEHLLRRQERYMGSLLHELRNPIAAIAMATEALAQFAAKSPEITAMSDVISRQSHAAGRLLDDLLELSRISLGKLELRKERLDLAAGLQRIVGECRPQFDERGLKVQWELPPGPVWVDGDVMRLSQAWRYLLESLIRLSQRGDEITIRVASLAGNKQAVIEIGEASRSIAPADLVSIFEPLDQHPATRGASLGLRLPLAKGLIELHGGEARAENVQPGKGIAFRIALPIADVFASQMSDADPQVAARRRSLRILVIDDNPDVGTSLEFLLKAAGHTLTVALSGRQGVAEARENRPDVVLCDIGLPDIDGYAVARQLRSIPETAAAYLVAVSGFASEEDERRSLMAGFDMHLNKPEGFVGLNARLQELPIRRSD